MQEFCFGKCFRWLALSRDEQNYISPLTNVKHSTQRLLATLLLAKLREVSKYEVVSGSNIWKYVPEKIQYLDTFQAMPPSAKEAKQSRFYFLYSSL